jgi:acetate kinase
VEWATVRASELLETPSSDLALVVAHLGSGCSATAVDAGRSAWTSMGMTPLEGLMMGTRSGSLDPGILVRLLHAGVTPDQLDEGLEHESGLLGVAGSADMRELLEREASGDERAALAIELFVRRAAEWIAAAATALPRLDGLVFTGGIGEHAAPVRARIVGRLGMLGLPTTLGDSDDDAALTARGAGPAVLLVTAREDLVIAEATRRLLD